MNKRLLKELRLLITQQNSRPLLENDYLVHFDEENLTRIYTLIKCPYDSVYRHKFIRLNFDIPDDYPHSPPSVNFVNHDSVRIHPNMYESGKCCATILNTWGDDKFEKWTSSMGIETILVMFHSFLDWNPYMYEPGGKDDPDYSVYVQHQSWISCLIRYLQYERIPLFNSMIHNYLLLNIDSIINDLDNLLEEYPRDYYYCRCFEIDEYEIDYQYVLYTLQNFYNYIEYKDISDQMDVCDINDKNWTCEICFDTATDNIINKKQFNLHCGHVFHKECLQQHIDKNFTICPMCRSELTDTDLNGINNIEINLEINEKTWMINPLTKRRIKIGGRTWQYLIDSGFLTMNEDKNENDYI